MWRVRQGREPDNLITLADVSSVMTDQSVVVADFGQDLGGIYFLYQSNDSRTWHWADLKHKIYDMERYICAEAAIEAVQDIADIYIFEDFPEFSRWYCECYCGRNGI